MKYSTLVTLFVIAGSSHQAAAQAQLVPKEDAIKGAGETDVSEWNPSLAGTATINMVSNSNVVGQVDGFSTLFGLGLVGGLEYVHGPHVLRNSLAISESFARTPVVDEFIKTNDVVQLESLYNYFVTNSLGAFGRFSLQTSAFPADDVRGLPTTWVEKPDMAGQPTSPLNDGVFRQRLAGAFRPFTINESLGGFAEPLKGEKLSLSIRLGIGGRHTWASKVLLIDDDKTTPEVELQRLSIVHQLGLEGFGGVTGKMKQGRLTYRAGLSVLLPFVNNDKFDRTATELTRVGLEASLTFNVFDWMSLVYSLTVTEDPQLFPADNELTQVQNNLLLTFKFAFVAKREAKKPPTKEELELIEAKARADAAEKRSQELEQQLKDAEAAKPAPEPTPPRVPSPMPMPTPTPVVPPAPAPVPPR